MDEFVIEWIKGSDYAGVTVPTGTSLKSKLLRLSKQHPDEVTNIIENNDGSLFCHVPVRYIKISPPKKVSETQRQAARDRFKKMWEDKQ